MTDLNENTIEICKLQYEIRVLWADVLSDRDICKRAKLYDKIIEKQNRISELESGKCLVGMA